MWQGKSRDELWSQMEQTWDIIVVGGGITGAGILREATRLGLRALLVEQRDYGWGTSSRSSKLVHGGLRYLKEGRLLLTRASVRERERLLEEGNGLVDPLGFLLATYKGDHPGRWTYNAGLAIYDLLALQWSHRHYSADEFKMLAPHIAREGLSGGFRYGDAQTDDARLVLRVLREAVGDGGVALNYVAAEHLLRDRDGTVTGVRLRDRVADRQTDVYARVVINATGAWADRMRAELGLSARVRPLRGSHLIFPAWRFPLAQAISFLHPIDYRSVFAFPWEGVTLVGTTDIDHRAALDEEPSISPEEVAYLMAAVEAQFPTLHLSPDDVLTTYAGVRPVINTGKTNPSEESRDHVIWLEEGLLTVTGGKLTTFRLLALDALKEVRDRLPGMPAVERNLRVFGPVSVDPPPGYSLEEAVWQRLVERYGSDAAALVRARGPGEVSGIPGTSYLWAELRWACRDEGVVHLDDLLLRRTRLGLLLPFGGQSLFAEIRGICQAELGWDDGSWNAEASAYLDVWHRCYSLPPRDAIPDWREMLNEARVSHEDQRRRSRRRQVIAWSATAASLTPALTLWFFRRHRRRAR